ncbi:nucleotide exchange factor GrpE [Prevotella sp. E9-3]|uniref:nucleotide exchange factor GrpE n=1 Tax=Prevotella sp. E9-3 TaxID=2913621 RepID=UPI001EDB6387|nr:nucleotide exchange factor GrpE [Prevotella sp. E9-3]UKK49539.1 nucleotide exchange factor GrpE [Prevotella sp. E9-3]
MTEEKNINEQNEELTTDEMAVESENVEVSDTENAENTESTESEDAEKTETEKLEEQIADLKDKYLRQVAEFDNYRKRTLKERTELILNGGEKVITTLLPILDDMERAIENGQKTEDPNVLREGMELIYHKLVKVMEGNGVSKIDTTDADFDTDLHEAVAMVPGMGDDKKGKVIDCLAAGYKLNDKVIRHAKVAVGQ